MTHTEPIFHILPIPSSDLEKQPLLDPKRPIDSSHMPLILNSDLKRTSYAKQNWPGFNPDLGSGPGKPKWLLPPFLVMLMLLTLWMIVPTFDFHAFGGIKRDSKNWCDHRLHNAKYIPATYSQPTSRGYPDEWERWSSNASFPLDSQKMLRFTVPSYVDGEVVISRLTSEHDQGSIVMQSWWSGEQKDLERLGKTGLWVDERAIQLNIKSDPMDQMVYHRIHILLPTNLSTVPRLLSNLPFRIHDDSRNANITFSDLYLTSAPCPSDHHHPRVRERDLSGEYNITTNGVIAFVTDKGDIDVDVDVINQDHDGEYEPRNRLDPRVEVSSGDDFTTQRAYYPFRHYPQWRNHKHQHDPTSHSGARIISTSDSGFAAIRIHTSGLPINNQHSPIEVDATSDSGNISIFFPNATPMTTVNANSDSGNTSIIFASDIKISASISSTSDSGNISIILTNHTDKTFVKIAAVTDSGSVSISDPAFLGHFTIITQSGGFYVGVEDTENKVVDVKDKMGGIMGGIMEGDISLRRGNGKDVKLGRVEVITDSGDIVTNY